MNLAVVLHNNRSQYYTDEEWGPIVEDAAVISKHLQALGYETILLPFSEELKSMYNSIRRLNPALVFNLVDYHEWGEKYAYLAYALCEILEVPFVGNPVVAHVLSTSKLITKKLLRGYGFDTPDWVSLEKVNAGNVIGTYLVKAVSEHGSYALDDSSIVVVEKESDLSKLYARIRTKAKEEVSFFAEKYVDGRDFRVVMLDNDVGVMEHAYRNTWPSNRVRMETEAAKWQFNSVDDKSTYRRFIWPEKDLPLIERLKKDARAIWEIFSLSGWAAVDFRVDASLRGWVIDVNVNPSLGVCDSTMKVFAKKGYSQFEVVSLLVRSALERHKGVGGLYT